MDTLSKTAIRSAEADRVSSCQFADNVAQSSIDFFRMVCPENLADAYKQTVIATIIVQTPINSSIKIDVESGFKILSLGVGTKVLNGNIISDERKTNISSGDRLVRDCHAEVVARRGFVAFLYTELERLSADANYFKNHNCIFEWSPHNKLQLKPRYTLHLYTSSQPCGNASNKKWAKCKAPPQYRNLSAHQFPTEIHNKIQITSKHEGQVAVLVKKNNYTVTFGAQTNINGGLADDTVALNIQSVLKNESLQATEQKEQHDTSTTVSHYQCLPGTAPVNSGEGNVMTCSDKIALWNVLGLQGSLLSQYFSPLHLSTITVGRKFSKIHAERALCCRLQEYCFPVTEGEENKNRRKNKKVKANETSSNTSTDMSVATDPTISLHVEEINVCNVAIVSSIPVSRSVQSNHELVNTSGSFRTVYKVNHPVMLSTKVKLDESAISTAIPTTNTAANSVTTMALGGAQFTDWRSLCCWFDSNSNGDSISNGSGIGNIGRENFLSDYQVEVIDGRTGLLYNSPDKSAASFESISSVDNSLISQLSSYSFGLKYKTLRRKFNNSNNTSNSINLAAQDISNENVNHSISCIPFTYRDMKATGCVCSCDAVSSIPLYQLTGAVDIKEAVKDSNIQTEISKTTIATTTPADDVVVGMNIANTLITEHTAAKRYLKSNDTFFGEWIQK